MLNTLRYISFYKIWTGSVLIIYAINFLISSELRAEALELFGDGLSLSRFILYLNWSLLTGGLSVWIGLSLRKDESQLRRAAYLTIPGLFNPARILILYHAGLLCFLGNINASMIPAPLSSIVTAIVFGVALIDGLLLAPLSSWLLFQEKVRIKQREQQRIPDLKRLGQGEGFSFL